MASIPVGALLLLLAAAGPCVSLRDVHISVPQYVLRGQAAKIRCHYELEGDTLYSVKWYKGNKEFYRFTPKEIPPKKTFDVHGVRVDVAQSNATQVTVMDADLTLSGRYSCEVSADAPSFHTFLVTGSMEVVVPPREQPHISGLKARYQPGDQLKASCSAGWSSPPATLELFLNDVKPFNRLLTRDEDERSDLRRSHLTLRTTVTSAMGPRLRLRCVASIGTVYWQSSEKTAIVRFDHSSEDEDEPLTIIEENEYDDGHIYPGETTVQPANSMASGIPTASQLWLLITAALVIVQRLSH